MSVDVEAYLQSKGVAFKRAGAGDVHCLCWWCNETEGKRGRLYIRTDPNDDPPGLFLCHKCGEKGAFNKIRKFYGDSALSEEEDSSYLLTDILNESAAYYHDLLSDNEDALKYLKYERGLTIETIIKHQLGWADGTLRKHLQVKGFHVADMQRTGLVDGNLHDFLNTSITIPYHVAGSVVQIRGKEIGGKYRTPPGQKARLFNTDSTWGVDELFTCEGELDACILEQLGFNAVGAPGAALWQQAWNGYFDAAKKVFICFDPDPAGILGADKVQRQLGPKAKILSLPVEEGEQAKNVDPTYLVAQKGWDKAAFEMLIIQSRGGILISVDESFEDWKSVQGVGGLELGIATLDHRLAPGVLPAQLMIILAGTGVGKTLLLLNIFHRMIMTKPDVKILFLSLEQTRSEWFERARRIHRFYNLNATNEDCLSFYRNNLMLIDKNRVPESELIACLDQYEYEQGRPPDLLAVDYLGYWARGYKGEGYERTSEAVMTLKAIAKERRIAIMAPHQVNRAMKSGEELEASGARDSGVVEETADFMFGMWTPDNVRGRQIHERNGEVDIKILKSRHGGKDSQAVLQFAPLSLALIPLGDDLFQRAKNDHEFYLQRDNWASAVMRHRTGNHDLSVKVQDDFK